MSDTPVIVSVLTPSLPERRDMLAECSASFAAQLFPCYEHLIEIDERRDGCATVMNRLADRAEGQWLLPLADDDLLLPGALGTLLAQAAGADIVYAPPLVTGNEDRWWFFQEPPVIPATALIRATLWRELGGYDETLTREEDRDLWVKACAADATFVRLDAPCWVYRQHAGNKSFTAEVAA